MIASQLGNVAWRKSSYSGQGGNCVEIADGWVKSSYSMQNGECVEVRAAQRVTAVRDSTRPEGPTLVFPAGAWDAFVAGAKTAR